MSYENKMATPSGGYLNTPDLIKNFEEINRAFEEFKSKNNQRLDGLKGDDVLLREEVDRIAADMASMKHTMESELLDQKRAAIFACGESYQHKSFESREYATKFEHYLRRGGTAAASELELAARKVPELKALSVGSNPDGGFTVLPFLDQQISNLSKLVSPIRQVAGVISVSTASLKTLINRRGTASGWVGETDGRAQTVASQFNEIEIPVQEIYANPATTQSLLDDSFVNIEQWISSEIADEFAQQEGLAFVSGSGLKKPRGFATQNMVADASWTFGNIGYVVTGASGAFAAAPNSGDVFYDAISALRPDYRANATWLLNRRTLSAIRKFKDSQGAYIWVPGLTAGQPDMIAGYPILECEDVPDIAASSFSIWFGDWRQGYLIVDRLGTRVLRDPFTAKPHILFYTTKRVGGAVKNFEAIKAIKFATS